MGLLRFVWESLWFFLPAFVGNQFPGMALWIMAKCNRSHWNVPVNERWLGKNKTWPAYPAAVLGAVLTVFLQRSVSSECLPDCSSSPWILGALFGIGIAAGDQIKSFFKRRIGIPPGERWWPFDQLDFVVGGLLAVSLLLGWKVWITAIAIVPFVLALHPMVNRFGYTLGLRKVPY
jgi:CDP-2,3-bis-(O-geranylgeranyl)-sn-glycerol synthase